MENLLLGKAILIVCISLSSAVHMPDSNNIRNVTVTSLQSLATPTTKFFQLKAQSNGKCLSLKSTKGTYVSCDNHESTIYYLNGNKANNYNIVAFGTSQCLDREHCHRSSSNLRYSPCNHCGAKHWDIRSDGSVREDNGKNCIYSKSMGTEAAVRHCKNGFEKFAVIPLGDQFLLKSVKHGDCVSGGKFVDCACAPAYYVTGTPRKYNIRLFLSGDTSSNICLDRERCHSSTSNLKFSECIHCGAKHWSIEGTKVGEDDMKNCINRGDNNVATMKHCSISHEELQYVIIPLPMCAATQEFEKSLLARYFRDPNINQYLHLNLEENCRGVKIFRYSQDGTLEVEVVHFLPSAQTFLSGQYYIQYIVTHIHTDIRFESYYTSEYVLERLSTDPSRITAINIRYGGVGGPDRNVYDGLVSEFLTNTGPGAGRPLPGQHYPRIASQIYNGFARATNNWFQYFDSVYQRFFSPQIFLSIASYHVALYWGPCNRQFNINQNQLCKLIMPKTL